MWSLVFLSALFSWTTVSTFSIPHSSKSFVPAFLSTCRDRHYDQRRRCHHHQQQQQQQQSSVVTFAQSRSGGGEVGSGPNWIERSFPVDMAEKIKVDPKAVIDYDLGISGVAYQTGDLSKRLFQAIESKSKLLNEASTSQEVKRGFLIYCMDFTAKEAIRAALKQNGLELVLTPDEEEEGRWAEIDSIRILNENGEPVNKNKRLYDSWEQAVDDWAPGMNFDFVVRQVPAKMRKLTLDELLQALDPDGTLRQQAKDAGVRLPAYDEMATLKDIANDNVQRTESAPRETKDEVNAFSGDPQKRGYRVIHASDLRYDDSVKNAGGTKTEKVLMHVMDSLVNHGCIIVDLTDGGVHFEKAEAMSNMWKTTESFFQALSSSTSQQSPPEIPGMTTLEGVGSPHAKVGFARYQEGNMQFLETRLARSNKDEERILYPLEAQSVLGDDGCQALRVAFDVVSQVGQDLVRIVVGASTRETGLLDDAQASKAALRVATELLDNGKPLPPNVDIQSKVNETSVSMSPHRLCLYSNQPSNKSVQETNEKSIVTVSSSAEIFGAHTDSSFVTVVPVAAVSGLEVYDEDAERWYRPELAARRYWQEEQQQQRERFSKNFTTDTLNETTDDGDDNDNGDDNAAQLLPWHARYLVCMPGELLQLCSRNEVLATVHRVVVATTTTTATTTTQKGQTSIKEGPSSSSSSSSSSVSSSHRLSAPILLRGRNGLKLDVNRYLGGLQATGDSILAECNGMTIEQIHNAMQPSL